MLVIHKNNGCPRSIASFIVPPLFFVHTHIMLWWKCYWNNTKGAEILRKRRNVQRDKTQVRYSVTFLMVFSNTYSTHKTPETLSWNSYESTYGSNISWREGTFLGVLWFSPKRSEKPPHPKPSHPKIHSEQKVVPQKRKYTDLGSASGSPIPSSNIMLVISTRESYFHPSAQCRHCVARHFRRAALRRHRAPVVV